MLSRRPTFLNLAGAALPEPAPGSEPIPQANPPRRIQTPAVKREPPQLTAELQEAHRLICEGCEFLSELNHDGARVCLHSKCGCWRSDKRKNPWEKLLRCAAGKF